MIEKQSIYDRWSCVISWDFGFHWFQALNGRLSMAFKYRACYDKTALNLILISP